MQDIYRQAARGDIVALREVESETGRLGARAHHRSVWTCAGPEAPDLPIVVFMLIIEGGGEVLVIELTQIDGPLARRAIRQIWSTLEH